MSMNTVLFYIVAADAFLILALGLVAAGLIITGTDIRYFWDRIVPATSIIIGTSIAAGVVLWIGDYMFVAGK